MQKQQRRRRGGRSHRALGERQREDERAEDAAHRLDLGQRRVLSRSEHEDAHEDRGEADEDEPPGRRPLDSGAEDRPQAEPHGDRPPDEVADDVHRTELGDITDIDEEEDQREEIREGDESTERQGDLQPESADPPVQVLRAELALTRLGREHRTGQAEREDRTDPLGVVARDQVKDHVHEQHEDVGRVGEQPNQPRRVDCPGLWEEASPGQVGQREGHDREQRHESNDVVEAVAHPFEPTTYRHREREGDEEEQRRETVPTKSATGMP